MIQANFSTTLLFFIQGGHETGPDTEKPVIIAGEIPQILSGKTPFTDKTRKWRITGNIFPVFMAN
jgi:hypothetical protein